MTASTPELAFDPQGSDMQRAYAALALALLGWISRECSVPVIIVKGPAAELQGLREARNFSDIDVLANPAGVGLLQQQLERRGWIARPFEDREGVFPKHSVAMYHPSWPIDIDLHYRFPGFEEPAEQVIAVLLESAVPVTAGSAQVLIPTRLATAAVEALHKLRSPWLPGTAEALSELHERFRDVETTELIAFAKRTGCLAALRPFLELRADLPEQEFPAPSPEWILRIHARSPASIRIFRMIQAPWRNKPKLLWKALFPSRQALAATDLAIEAEQRNLPLAYLQRLRRFVISLPVTVRSVRELLAANGKSSSSKSETSHDHRQEIASESRKDQRRAD